MNRIKASDVALQAVQSTHDQEKAASRAVVDEHKAQLNECIAERNTIILDLVGPPNEGERPGELPGSCGRVADHCSVACGSDPRLQAKEHHHPSSGSRCGKGSAGRA